jgi:hypothetical protein
MIVKECPMQEVTGPIRLISVLVVALIGMSMPVLSAYAEDETARPPQVSSSSEDQVSPPSENPETAAAASASTAQTPGTVHTLGVLPSADLGIPPLPPTEKMQVQKSGTVAYVTGGVGQEERQALEAAQNNYNLHITVSNREGQFLADTRITIRDRKGNEILEAIAGPIFNVQIQSGTYTVEAASSEGQIKKQTVTVGKGKRPTSLHFTW